MKDGLDQAWYPEWKRSGPARSWQCNCDLVQRFSIIDSMSAADDSLQPVALAPPDLFLAGMLHVYVAFDWGEEIDLEKAKTLVPAEVRALPRRRRTPSSIAYRPPPLHFVLAGPSFELPEQGATVAQAEATVFDFGAVSVALHLRFGLTAGGLSALAGKLAGPTSWVLAGARQSDRFISTCCRPFRHRSGATR